MTVTKEQFGYYDLIPEYEQGLSQLQSVSARLREQKQRLVAADRPIPKQLDDKLTINNSMIQSMSYALQWMRTGREPNARRGVDKRGIYQRQFAELMETIPDIVDEIREEDHKPLLTTSEERAKLHEIFATWTEREAYCFIAHTAHLMSLQEIADKLGVRKTSVQNYLERAKKKIADIVGK